MLSQDVPRAVIPPRRFLRRGRSDRHRRLPLANLPPRLPALDRSSVAALGAVLVRHPSITAGDEVLVEFRTDAQSITVPATAFVDTAVTVLAPPLLDAVTGVPVVGTVEVSLQGGPSTTLVIDEPPDV